MYTILLFQVFLSNTNNMYNYKAAEYTDYISDEG